MNEIGDLDFIDGLRTRPETYKTLLKLNYNNRNTITNLVRKKLSILTRFNFISASILDGTRFGGKIFYHPEKEYFIFIIRKQGIFYYYYSFDCAEDKSGIHVKLIECHILDDIDWKYLGNYVVLKDNIVRWF